MMSDDDLQRIERVLALSARPEHAYWRHTIPRLVAEVRALRAERHELASALVAAAQHERSRLATADHQRDLADGWLDLARRSLPAPPTSDEMIGIFQRADQEDDR